MSTYPQPVCERIERHIIGPMTDDDCWVTDYKPQDKHGYVRIGITNVGDANIRGLLHRVAWEAHNAEPIPEEMVVMHTCDNPACCNPNHLRLGTQLENIQDCVRKDRRYKGKAG